MFLRTWDDYEQTTIKLTAHATSGVGRTNLRAESPEALERRVKEIQASGRGVGWAAGDPGYGPAYVFTDPEALRHLALRFDTLRGESLKVSESRALIRRLADIWSTGVSPLTATPAADSA